MEFFTFEPSDFQVLEDIEFDETIERPEKVRFYTLEEQATDAFEKLVPPGRVTNYQLNQVKKQIDRFRDLYTTYIVETPTDYRLREPRIGSQFSWVSPVYATPDLKAYSWADEWNPLYENTLIKGYYPRMISALPRPFASVADGQPFALEETTEFVSPAGDQPLRALPVYVRTRAQIHEDQTMDIVDVPIEGTADVMNFVGYHLRKRPLDIPNPLMEHPFFKANEDTFVETTSAWKDVLPSMETILEHGVPVTQNPYAEAQPFLKLYDVNLGDIPWSAWKRKFPPAERIDQPLPVEDIPFPKSKELAPPENLVTAYKSVYSPGLSARYWLMNQLDGGEYVTKLLLSEAINNGSVELRPGVDMKSANYPQTTPAECELLGKTFQQFNVSGILRRKWVGDRVSYECVPLEFIKQERSDIGFKNRLAWKESTADDIRKSYRDALAAAFPVLPIESKKVTETKTPLRNESILRKEILLILDDPHRFAEDKLKDVRELLKTATLTGKTYVDADGVFVCCGHTLSLLEGDYVRDKVAFYGTWTVQENGFRNCKYCGERISLDDLVEQDEYDEDGFVIRQAGVLVQKDLQANLNASFVTGLQGLRPLFRLENPVDDVCFLLLSLLQVLPNGQTVESLVKMGREVAFKQYGDKSTAQANKFRGAIGFVITVLLLQMHIPALIPRRSFGNKPLKLSGYPRDADKPEDYSILDSLLLVLRKTFEEYPTAFKGASSVFVRAVLNDSKDIKNAARVFLDKVFLVRPDIRRGLDEAKSHYQGMPSVEQPNTLLSVVAPPKEMNTVKGYPLCPTVHPLWTNGRPAPIVQREVPLRSGLFPATTLEVIDPAVSIRETPAPIPKAEIVQRYKKKTGLQPVVSIGEDYKTNLAIASRLADVFELPTSIRNVDPSQNKDELRDIAQGYLADLLRTIQADPVKRTKLERMKTSDATLYTLLADFQEEKASANRLRARERLAFVERMGRKSDEDREVISGLLRIGAAPYVITNQDRELFARQAEQLRETTRMQEQDFDVDVGVGEPRGYEDQGDEFVGGTDHGDYGDLEPLPRNDGRDYEQPYLGEDAETSI